MCHCLGDTAQLPPALPELSQPSAQQVGSLLQALALENWRGENSSQNPAHTLHSELPALPLSPVPVCSATSCHPSLPRHPTQFNSCCLFWVSLQSSRQCPLSSTSSALLTWQLHLSPGTSPCSSSSPAPTPGATATPPGLSRAPASPAQLTDTPTYRNQNIQAFEFLLQTKKNSSNPLFPVFSRHIQLESWQVVSAQAALQSSSPRCVPAPGSTTPHMAPAAPEMWDEHSLGTGQGGGAEEGSDRGSTAEPGRL